MTMLPQTPTLVTDGVGLPYAAFAGAIAASGNSGLIYGPGLTLSATLTLAGATGSGTVAVALQVSDDGANNWKNIASFPVQTGAGSVSLPPVRVPGYRRWVWTVTGSLAFSSAVINEFQNGGQSNTAAAAWIDNTAALLAGTLAATSASVWIGGATIISGSISAGAITTTGATYQTQTSPDGANWSPVGAAFIAAANSTASGGGVCPTGAAFARLIVTGAGSGQTGNIAQITAS